MSPAAVPIAPYDLRDRLRPPHRPAGIVMRSSTNPPRRTRLVDGRGLATAREYGEPVRLILSDPSLTVLECEGRRAE